MDQAQGLRNIIKQQTPKRTTARVITITSGKGGVGKSNVSVNLALNLSEKGKRVIIIDADFGLANVEIMLGIRPRFNLADLIFSGKTLSDIITKGPQNVGFISGGSGIQELNNLKKEQITSFILKLNELDQLADIIIVDTGAGITNAVLEFISVSEEVILVTTPEPTSITDSYSLLKSLNRNKEFYLENTSIKLISNKVTSKREGLEIHNKINVVSQKFLDIPIEYLGDIPEDPLVTKAVIRQGPITLLYPNAAFTKAISKISDEIYQGKRVKSVEGKGIAGLFMNMIRKAR